MHNNIFTVNQIIKLSKELTALQTEKLLISHKYSLHQFAKPFAGRAKVAEELLAGIIEKYGVPSTTAPNTFTIPADKVADYRAEEDALLTKEDNVPMDLSKIDFEWIQGIESSNSYSELFELLLTADK